MKTNLTHQTLPEGYALHEKIDLVHNRKQMLLVNGLAIFLALIMLGIGFACLPEGAVFFHFETLDSAIRGLITIVGFVAYIVGHEIVHGVFMWYFSHKKPNFGLSFTYAYAGSDAYFSKKPYLIIALAPVVVWAVLLLVLHLLLPAVWFWPIMLIQLTNVSGAAGDFYVSAKILRMSDDVLVQDTGTAMTVYLPA